MFSEVLMEALKREVVGQPQAIHSVVRGVTRLLSGLTPTERSWCAYLFIGPPGTGRTHLVRTLARLLHGEEALCTLNCNPGGHPDPWLWFAQQLAPVLERHAAERVAGQASTVLLIHDLEHANKELYPVLAHVLETGQVPLEGGRTARLDNCLIFLTSALCTAEILETDRMGFSSAASVDGDGEELETIVKICKGQAESVFGVDLLAQIDHHIVFRRLEEEHLACVLDSHFARMSRWLARSGIRCDMLPEAKAFLLERGSRRAQLGARDLILTHRREVEFPLADLILSSRLGSGDNVVVGRRPDREHLHFTVEPSRRPVAERAPHSGAIEIPVS